MADLSQFLYATQPLEAPEGVRTPWQGLPPARADQMRQRAFEQGQKYIQDNASIVSQGAENMKLLEKFGELNRQSGTGALYEGSLSSFMPESLRGADEKIMQSITSDLAPKKRLAGSGTTSDKDIALYLESLPSIAKDGDVNQKIRDNYRQQYEKANAKLQFMQQYFDQYGHLNGADAIWQQQNKVVNQNPPKGATNKLFQDADAIIKGR
jgi:hypothetical protein